MLTADLVRVRSKEGRIEPRWLEGAARERALGLAKGYLEIYEGQIGQRRERVETELARVEVAVRDRVLAQGLKKLLDDRAEWACRSPVDPSELRLAVFDRAALAHRSLGIADRFDRAAVLAAVASERGVTPEEIDASLFADLRQNEVLERFSPLPATDLVDRYNLGLAQAILLRATEVRVTFTAIEVAELRAFFRALRFFGLLYVARALEAGGYRITIDGPFSLFDAVQRYGLRLALVLPCVLACPDFRLEADVRWGAQKRNVRFELDHGRGLRGQPMWPSAAGPDLDAFCAAFDKLGSSWTVRPSDRLFTLPGHVVCIPDLVFDNRQTGEEVFLEAFGFWSRKAVWQRIELLRQGVPARIILAVGKQLRVSKDLLDDTEMGEIYVYRRTMSARDVLEKLESGQRSPISGQP